MQKLKNADGLQNKQFMADYLNDVKLAHTRMSIGSLKKNPSNYQVFSFYITMAFIFGISILLGSLITFTTEDQNLSPSATMILVFINTAIVIILFIAYNTYLKNIGKYVYGRMKPIQENVNKSDKSLVNVHTGTSAPTQRPSIPGVRSRQEHRREQTPSDLIARAIENNSMGNNESSIEGLFEQ